MTSASSPATPAVIRPAFVLFVLLSALTGLVYPLLVTGIGQAAFPAQAAGSLVERDGKPVGSALIGQSFSEPKYVWGRPSATGPMANNAGASSGSNLGPLNPALADAVKGRIEALRAADPGNTAPVPIDLVTASGSGLDPHISVAAAQFQAARVAKARGLPLPLVNQLIATAHRGPPARLHRRAARQRAAAEPGAGRSARLTVDLGYALLALGAIGLPLLLAWKLLGGFGPAPQTAPGSDNPQRSRGPPRMLINCVAYQEGARLIDLPVDDISDYLDRPGCFVWVALRDPAADELDAMRREFDLHPLAVEDASHGHQRPKVEEYGDALFVVMQLVEFVGGELNVGGSRGVRRAELRAVGAHRAASSTFSACASAASASRTC